MNSKSINRNVCALTLSLCGLCLGGIGFAANPQLEKGAGVETMSAKPCHAQWVIGTHSTGWIYLGDVSGFLANKKKKCKELAMANCGRPEPINLVKNYVPANQGCAGIDVYFDTRVEGKINSKDGTCKVKPSCTCSAWTYN